MSGSSIGRAQPKSSQRRPSGQNRAGVRDAKLTSLPKVSRVAESKPTRGGESKVQSKSEVPETPIVRKPTGIRRASVWNPSVEEQYRLQCAGWRSIDEYCAAYDAPERWKSNQFFKCLRVKSNGYYTYWREWRECEDKYLNRVKIFTYAAEAKA
ncbi:hypothetical protein TrCOL_g6046 [Triparma columacea]|uniref:Uncharacterized protein n=1 Tax=Triparma columacea TaxID=722753 RepID=A0A9W7GEW7_9STRA|nr:hypothetical protein TrCOL_g6046 [Triparma columacea]